MEKIINLLKGKEELFSILFVVGILIPLGYLWTGCNWETNDDPQMAMRIAGMAVLHAPNPWVIFSHIFYTYPLSLLSEISPSIPWYSISQFFVLAFSWVVFLRFFLKSRNVHPIIRFIFFLLGFIVSGYTFIQTLQFTMVSGMLTLAALLLFYEVMENGSYKVVAFAVISLLFASFIRWESVVLLVILSIPFWAASWYDRRFLKKSFVWILLGTLVLCFLGQELNRNLHQNRDGYYLFNFHRAYIQEFRVLDQIENSQKENILSSVDWTPNTLQLQYNWYLPPDEPLFSSENYRSLYESFQSVKGSKIIDWKQSVNVALSKLRQVFSLSMIFTMLFAALFLRRWFLFSGIMLLQMAGIFIVFFAMNAFAKDAPYRVMMILQYAHILFLLIWVLKDPESIQEWKLPLFRLVPAIGILLSFSYLVRNQNAFIQFQKMRSEGGIAQALKTRELLASYPLKVCWSSSLYLKYLLLPNEAPNTLKGDHYILTLYQQMQEDQELLRSHGYKTLRDALLSGKVPIISNQAGFKATFASYAEFIKENYGKEIEYEVIDKSGRDIVFFLKESS